jgi:hypothetical protein
MSLLYMCRREGLGIVGTEGDLWMMEVMCEIGAASMSIGPTHYNVSIMSLCIFIHREISTYPQNEDSPPH